MASQSQTSLLLALCLCVALFCDVHGSFDDHESWEYGIIEDERDYVSDWNTEWAMAGGRLSQVKCIDIPANLSLCRDIGYHQMRLPNLLDHDTVREVTQQAASWVPLLGIRCHPDTKLFLCSLFSPVCLDRPIFPCRTLCQAVKNGCESRMLKYGFPWPEMLRCDKFPLDNDLCIGLQHDNKPDESVCEPCGQPDTYESIIDNYCSAEFALRIEVDENVIIGNDMKLVTGHKKKKLKKGDIRKKELRDLLLYIENGANCDCRYLGEHRLAQQSQGGSPAANKFVVMGSRKDDKLVVQYMVRDDRSSKPLKKALKQFKSGSDSICQGGLHVMTGGRDGEGGRKGGRRKNKRRENGNRDRPEELDRVQNQEPAQENRQPPTEVEPTEVEPTEVEPTNREESQVEEERQDNDRQRNKKDRSKKSRNRDGKKKRKRCKNEKKCGEAKDRSERRRDRERRGRKDRASREE